MLTQKGFRVRTGAKQQMGVFKRADAALKQWWSPQWLLRSPGLGRREDLISSQWSNSLLSLKALTKMSLLALAKLIMSDLIATWWVLVPVRYHDRDLKRQWPPPPVSTLLAGSGTWPHVRSRAGSSGIGALTERPLASARSLCHAASTRLYKKTSLWTRVTCAATGDLPALLRLRGPIFRELAKISVLSFFFTRGEQLMGGGCALCEDGSGPGGDYSLYTFCWLHFGQKLSDNKLITNCKSDTKINDFTDYVPLNLF